MVGVEQPIELTAAPIDERDEPRIERIENEIQATQRACAEVAALQSRDHRVAAARTAAELGLRPVAPVPQRADGSTDPLPIHGDQSPDGGLPHAYRAEYDPDGERLHR